MLGASFNHSTVSIPSTALHHFHEGAGCLDRKKKAGKLEAKAWVWGDTAACPRQVGTPIEHSREGPKPKLKVETQKSLRGHCKLHCLCCFRGEEETFFQTIQARKIQSLK